MMKAWKNYRCWWEAHGRAEWQCDKTFEEYINGMSLHELMQTLEDWENNTQ